MGHALGNNYGKHYNFLSKPVDLDLRFTVNQGDTGGLGVTAVKGQGVENVFMYTSQTPGKGPNGYLNPNPAVGICLIQLAYNYTRWYNDSWNIHSPVTGGSLAINATALTAGQPYEIVTVGHSTTAAATIAPVADSSGSLAGTWFNLYDNYGQHFVIWFSVSGVGKAPSGTGGILVQQSITTGDSAATIGAALAITIAALPSTVASVFSFTAAGTTTVTVTSTVTANPFPFPGPPSEGAVPTGFTFAVTKYTSNVGDWRGVGLPPGIAPAIGVSFIATATGYTTGGSSTGTVKAIGVSGVTAMEIIGNPDLSIAPTPVGPSAFPGSWIMVQFIAPTSASVTTMIPTAPADTSVVYMRMLLEQAARVGGNGE